MHVRKQAAVISLAILVWFVAITPVRADYALISIMYGCIIPQLLDTHGVAAS